MYIGGCVFSTKSSSSSMSGVIPSSRSGFDWEGEEKSGEGEMKENKREGKGEKR